MESLAAGFVAGYAMGIVSLVIFAPTLLSLGEALRSWQARFPAGTPLALLTAGMALLTQSVLGLGGLVMGALYWAVGTEAADGLGSPAWGYSLAMVILAALAAGVGVMIQPGWWRRAGMTAILFAGAFGWLLPHLAET